MDDIDLMPLLMSSPDLDAVEANLRAAGHAEQADRLLKLQQDAGVQMSGAPLDQPAPGPESAKLLKNFESVTAARVRAVLRAVGDASPSDQVFLKNLLRDLNLAAFQSPDASGPDIDSLTP